VLRRTGVSFRKLRDIGDKSEMYLSHPPLFSLNSRSERRNGIERVGWEVGRNGKFVICDLYMIREGREKKK